MKRPDDATDAIYEITARCLDCETTESWLVYEDDIERDGPEDAIENESEAARLWLSDHHENEHAADDAGVSDSAVSDSRGKS